VVLSASVIELHKASARHHFLRRLMCSIGQYQIGMPRRSDSARALQHGMEKSVKCHIDDDFLPQTEGKDRASEKLCYIQNNASSTIFWDRSDEAAYIYSVQVR
jgi:hypothetical protein